MRADRLISILLLLQVHRQLTARALAERLEVSERTILRDMEALCAAGVPVVADRGVGGGWRLLNGYRTVLNGLNAAEIQALFMTGPATLLADLKLEKAAEGALAKLLAALPAISRRDAAYARQRIHIDLAGWSRAEEAVPFLPTLQEAVWQERRIDLGYERNDGTRVERRVDPLGLVAKGSIWYLVAAVEGEARTYRVSRVRDAALCEERCARPEGFDLAGFWEQSNAEFKASLPQYRATMRVDPSILPRLRFAGRFARIEAVEGPEEDGWSRVSIRFQLEEEAREFALGFGARIEVIEPAELRAQVVAAAEETMTFYAGRGGG